MKKLALLAALFAFTFSAKSQKSHNWCITDEVVEEHSQFHSDYAEGVVEARQIIESSLQSEKNKSQGVVYQIPVVFHVIYADYRDNITRAQIEDGLRVLNEDFRRLNPDASATRAVFQGIAADAEIEFVLAKKDPQGNCTDGITRTQSSLSINARDNVKDLIDWDNKKYFNVWVVNSINPQGQTGTVLGYAYLPATNQGYKQDGMVIRHDRVGTIGTSTSVGRTFTHEAGHYLGLRHPFGSGSSCSQGDGVSDTPPVASPNFGCNLNANSCNNDSPDLPDMVENYMDYADDNCQNAFTQGQVNIMRAVLQSSNLRLNLRSNTNLSNTGVTNPPACTPTAIFNSDKKVVCAGDNVSFNDMSEDGDPTSWNWTFNGGNPSTSTSENPLVNYSVPGVYDVSLTVSNSAGSNTTTYSNEIHVKDFPGSYYANWVEDFEDATIPMPDVTIIDAGDGISFELFKQAGSNSAQSLKLDNFSSGVIGETDDVISAAINTIFTEDLELSFDYAFAAKDNADSDELKVYASIDCGENWIIRRFYKGSQLRTGGLTSSPYTPAANEWTTQTINFDAYIGPDPLLIKFEFTNGGGNNFYLDNINFTGTIGVEEYYSNHVNVFPNPASDFIIIESSLLRLNGASIALTDINGKEILRDVVQTETDEVKLEIDRYDLPAGLYTLILSNEGKTAAKKISILP